MQSIFIAQELNEFLNRITFLFHKNTWRKFAFLAVYYNLNNEISLRYVNEVAKCGGLIGPGKSNLDFFQMFQGVPPTCNFSCCFWFHEK